ncbi:nucleoside 2-deoxyribosyltransferase [Apilactobacillus timberlakei]|uniref:Nucleoside 2-deoxyribosyltransferase n=1 Tax=Apilactobacillus timberlakei TaxID=2008380 RepID=A0ABY2YT21_9LACO|nr:nucleoside 2-deoxyribosyltransferase [Apilactobacillus timberlakei]TPR13814.1 nucleoside 2-deoxyribosyltransferase [Apilactobacillus timberlakei]TPR15129.1 nucleoside 2-deoxyribosyltransferase [Apilactobacillus timberlakei]TPR17021.1 nucleoside 2-deoxyribosyltransferase [Apilactobacillus timberlakei]TPR17424.1 nucleoside 2-deoxyribosyltransferase [Apilactobacillus timberlakei]TPR20015.1 nucleoside 2-deoxyribosyltransferase [Apilactobacillus timberlakei]
MNLYLASPFFDDEQIDRISRIETALAKNNTVNSVFSPRKSEVKDCEVGTKQWSKKVFKLDTDEIKKADAIIAIIDYVEDNVDSGTAFEIGYAKAINKPIIIFHEKDNNVNLMLSNSSIAYLTKVEEVKNYDFNNLPESYYEGKVF